MKSKRTIVIIILFILLAAACAAVGLYLYAAPALAAGRLLENLITAPELEMDIKLSADDLTVSAGVCRFNANDRSVTRIQLGQTPLFYSEGILYLENGKAFQLTSQAPGTTHTFSAISFLSIIGDISRKSNGSEDIYHLKLDSEKTEQILAMILQGWETLLPETNGLEITLQGHGSNITHLEIRGTDLLLAFTIPGSSDHPREVPQAILDAMESSAHPQPAKPFLRLITACQTLYERDTIATELVLTADCGILKFSTPFSLCFTRAGGKEITAFGTENDYLYFSGGQVLDKRGNAFTSPASDVEALPGLIYLAVLNGDIESSQNGVEEAFLLSLDQAQMEALLNTIAPEIMKAGVQLDTGSLCLNLESGNLKSIELHCHGTVSVLFTQADASVELKLAILEDADFTVPQAVLDKLN